MIDVVGKIGTMALVNEKYGDIDYNKFAAISRWLHAGVIWVTSGAVEIGRLDYIKRNGCELSGDEEENKTDYAAQGQNILMQTYRQYTPSAISLRQVLVEHGHFNNSKSRERILKMLVRAGEQNAVPIVNYNDAVSSEESRRTEIMALSQAGQRPVELVDNDETAAQIACLTDARTLLLLTKLDGVYENLEDKSSLIREISGSKEQVISKIDEYKKHCHGASRKGANGAFAKLEFVKPCVEKGIKVIIASANYDIPEILNGNAPATRIITNN